MRASNRIAPAGCTPDKVEAVTKYLIRSFPERQRPPAVISNGPEKATIRMFDAPTPGSRPHDPLATRDGAIWYTESSPTVSGASIRRRGR